MLGPPCIFISLFLVSSTNSQLIGFRGVFTLPEGQEYRDSITREASKLVAEFAKNLEEEENTKTRIHQLPDLSLSYTPFYGPQDNLIGRPLTPNEVVDYTDSQSLQPALDQRTNRKLESVEIERATSSVRLLPEPTSPPNQLQRLTETRIERPNIKTDLPPSVEIPSFTNVRTQSVVFDGQSSFPFVSHAVPVQVSNPPRLAVTPTPVPVHLFSPRTLIPKILVPNPLGPSSLGPNPLGPSTLGPITGDGSFSQRLTLGLASTPRPPVFERTPSSLTDINSDRISSNKFGSDRMERFLVEGPAYSVSWG